jgi:hypothetical protein
VIDAASSVTVPDHVAHRAFEGETVVLNLDSGQYHGLNPTAARMFELLAEHGRIEAAASAAASEYGRPQDEVVADLVRLCEQLAERGLIVVTDGHAETN